MTAFFSRRGGAASRKPSVPIRVGHIYLDTRQHVLYCLNETAQQLLHEGVPLSGRVCADGPLRTLDGEPITADQLPWLRAWRERTAQENSFLLLGSDGMARHLTWNASPLVVADGSVRGIASSLVVAPFEADWQQLAGLAHDLRTPLQSLRLLLPFLENTPLPPQTRSILERLRSGMERTLSVSRDLLEWTRAPARGGRCVQRQWFPLEPFLIALTDEQAADAQRKGIAWQTDFAAAHNREINTDRVRLGRLLANLLSNAIRYTSQGEIRISAAWRNRAGGFPLFVLTVEDTGSGISPEDQESIFQPFERGKAGKDSDSSGSGLGLAVVDRLVEELGLTLEITSESGQGSKFELLLTADSIRPIEHQG